MSEPPTIEPPFVRFAALVRRELGAEDVRIIEPSAGTTSAPNLLLTTLPDGARVAVTFAVPPENLEALARRLDMLAGTFAQTAKDVPARTRFTLGRSLHDELRALSQRAQAVDALVLDAHSPVVWGSATHRGPHEERAAEGADLHLVEDVEDTARFLSRELPSIAEIGPARTPPPSPQPTVASSPDASGASLVAPAASSATTLDGEERVAPVAPFSAHALRHEAEELGEPSHRAIREVRALEGLPELRRGKALHHHQRAEDFGFVAHSFAGIYVLVLVFEAEYDELRAERALQDALPRIERLVLALPPLDPTPEPRGNVVSLRRRRS